MDTGGDRVAAEPKGMKKEIFSETETYTMTTV
jgi:hypothetical protein